MILPTALLIDKRITDYWGWTENSAPEEEPMRIINIILGLLFFGFAAMQFNDADPYLWIALYGALGLISLMAAFDTYSIWLILAVLIGCIYQLFLLFPAFLTWIRSDMPSITASMQAENIHVELVREFLGLILCTLVLAVHILGFWKKYKREEMKS